MTTCALAVRDFDSLTVGETAFCTHTITTEMVDAFASLTGDNNPLHTDDAYAQTTPHGARVAHGFLSAAFVSELIGMHLPGKYALILSETLKFSLPVFINDMLTVSGTISQKSESTRTITVDVRITRGADIVVRGSVVVRVEDTMTNTPT